MNCPRCNASGAYIGLNVVECLNERCEHFKAPERPAEMPPLPEKLFYTDDVDGHPCVMVSNGACVVRSGNGRWYAQRWSHDDDDWYDCADGRPTVYDALADALGLTKAGQLSARPGWLWGHGGWSFRGQFRIPALSTTETVPGAWLEHEACVLAAERERQCE